MLGKSLLNRYVLESELGRGGMGIVYRARDERLGRMVAVKVLNAEGLGTSGRARLLAEARAAAQLNHPNIVTIHDTDEEEGRPFIVMELVAGQTLRVYYPKSLGETIEIAHQICAALEHAHASGIIHRDLKPENIIIMQSQTGSQETDSPGGLRVKLMDFGLARSIDRDISQHPVTGAVVGTFAYLAPELWMEQPASVQSDLYALGVLLYEMVTGQPPFQGEIASLLNQHLNNIPVSPHEYNPEISPELEGVILGLLRKAPGDRPASAAEVAKALGHPLTGVVTPMEVHREHLNTNLPVQLSSFIGREDEIKRVKERLQNNRLVTLVGSGGIGKTRLALQVAAELSGNYPGGAWQVELAPLTDPALVSQTICAALSVSPQGETPALQVLTDFLRAKKILLVLDNCEHLIGACAHLVETLLRACPGLQLLASSREALGISGENIHRVPSLSLPGPDAGLTAISTSEAVKLFLARAGAVLPDFQLTEANAPVVAQICQRLDGIALAIELAAARVKMLSVEQIAVRLDDAFRLLTGGSRTALPRQQTLRALVDWSYELLSDEERIVLRRLAVFMGGCTFEAAEAICDNPDTLDLLTRLVDKSLVAVDHERGGESRYYFLETIRQYARVKLIESGEEGNVCDRHVRYFLNLAKEAEPHLRFGVEQFIWLDRLEAEQDNLRAALGWAMEYMCQEGVELATSLLWFWVLRGYLSEGYELLGKLLENNTCDDVNLRAKLYFGMGRLALYLDNHQKSGQFLSESIALFRSTTDKNGLALALLTLGEVARSRVEHAQAKELFEESRTLFNAEGNKWGISRALEMLADLEKIQGDYEQAQALYRQVFSLTKEMNDPDGMCDSLLGLGMIEGFQAHYEQAAVTHKQALLIAQKRGFTYSAVELLVQLGDVTLALGSLTQARMFIEQGIKISKSAGFNKELAMSYCLAAKLARLQKNRTEGDAYLRQSLMLIRDLIADDNFLGDILLESIALHIDCGKFTEAVRLAGALERALPLIYKNILPAARAEYQQVIALAQAKLDGETCNAIYAEGRAMSLEQAVESALEELQA